MSLRRLHHTEHLASGRLRWAVLFSVVVHISAVIILSQMQGGATEREFFAPIHMVELNAPGPAAPPARTPAPAPTPKPAPKPKPAPAVPKPPPAQAKPAPAPEEVIPVGDPVEKPRTEADVQKRLEELRKKYATQEPAQTQPQGTEEDVRSAVDRLRERYAQPEAAPAPTQAEPTERIGAGGGRTAGNSVMQQMQYTAYYNRVWAHVKRNWVIPPSLNTRGLSATVGVVIDRDGNIQHYELEESSRSEVYDETTIKALIRATPLPPIPSDLDEDVLELGFIFRDQ